MRVQNSSSSTLELTQAPRSDLQVTAWHMQHMGVKLQMLDLELPAVSKCQSCKLRKQNSFCNLPREALIELDRIKQVRTFAVGDRLFDEGQPVHQLMILCEGAATLTFSSSAGKVVMLGLSERGEVLGLSSAISARRHEVSACALLPAIERLLRHSHLAADVTDLFAGFCLPQSIHNLLFQMVLSWYSCLLWLPSKGPHSCRFFQLSSCLIFGVWVISR